MLFVTVMVDIVMVTPMGAVVLAMSVTAWPLVESAYEVGR